MNQKLLEEAKKYRVSLKKYASIYLDNNQFKAKNWRDAIDNFLRENKIEDAKVKIETGYYDSQFESIYVYSEEIMKSEEEIRKEIQGMKDLIAFKRKEARERAKARKEAEYQIYLKLDKKFKKKGSKNG